MGHLFGAITPAGFWAGFSIVMFSLAAILVDRAERNEDHDAQ